MLLTRCNVLIDWQRELEDRAPGRIGARPQSSAVPFYDRATDRQPESQAIRLGRVEGLEEMLESGGANPGPESRTATSMSSDSLLPFVLSNSRDPSLVAARVRLESKSRSAIAGSRENAPS